MKTKTIKQVRNYLDGKAVEVAQANSADNKYYVIPYSQNQNVLRYMDKAGYSHNDYHKRYSHDYKYLIVII